MSVLQLLMDHVPAVRAGGGQRGTGGPTDPPTPPDLSSPPPSPTDWSPGEVEGYHQWGPRMSGGGFASGSSSGGFASGSSSGGSRRVDLRGLGSLQDAADRHVARQRLMQAAAAVAGLDQARQTVAQMQGILDAAMEDGVVVEVVDEDCVPREVSLAVMAQKPWVQGVPDEEMRQGQRQQREGQGSAVVLPLHELLVLEDPARRRVRVGDALSALACAAGPVLNLCQA
jgi:hypothetical protein